MSVADERAHFGSRLTRHSGSSRRWVRVAVAGLAGACLAGCARSARLDERITRIGAALVEVEAQGAMRCAPRELAIAQSQLEFAQLEREQGDVARAFTHLGVADENVRAARLLAEPGRCEAPPPGAASPERRSPNEAAVP